MRNKTKNMLIVGAIILAFVMIAGLFAKIGNMETNKNLGVTSYAVGAINDSGKVIDSELSIYTKDYHKIKDAKITLSDDATISYRLYYYTEDKTFVSKSDSFTADYDTTKTPATAVYFRVVIVPAQVDGEAVKINALGMNKYVNQIKITVAK